MPLWSRVQNRVLRIDRHSHCLIDRFQWITDDRWTLSHVARREATGRPLHITRSVLSTLCLSTTQQERTKRLFHRQLGRQWILWKFCSRDCNSFTQWESHWGVWWGLLEGKSYWDCYACWQIFMPFFQQHVSTIDRQSLLSIGRYPPSSSKTILCIDRYHTWYIDRY